MSQSVILWVRRELRVNDHPALAQASQQGQNVIPVFIEEPWRAGPSPWIGNESAMGERQRHFVLQGLWAMQESLGGMLYRKGNPAAVLQVIAKEYGAKRVYCTAGHAPYERADEEEVGGALELIRCEGSTLLHPEDLPFEIQNLPPIFTQFRNRVEKEWTVRDVLQHELPVVLAPKEVPDPGEGPEADGRTVVPFFGSEQDGLERMHHYFGGTQSLSVYKETRNGLLGLDYSSKFSPWLATGALSPRTVYQAIRAYEVTYGANDSTYWLIFELLWRDYFAWVARKYGRRLYAGSGLEGAKDAPAWNTRAQNAFKHWCNGQTGQDFVDACMRELAATGFLSNRGRQVAASYLVHDLGVDWRAGAAWFEHHLIDHDPASNAGNWLYIAGRGNDPRPVRRFNPEGQAERYDPEGEYRRVWA